MAHYEYNYHWPKNRSCRRKKRRNSHHFVHDKDGIKIVINITNDNTNPIAFNGGRNVGENYAERGGEIEVSWAGDDLAERGGEIDQTKAGRDLAQKGGEIDNEADVEVARAGRNLAQRGGTNL